MSVIIMVGNIHEILFLVANDFVSLSTLQQKNIGVKLGLVNIGFIMNKDPEFVATTVFSRAYKEQKISELVKEMRQYLYE